MGVFQFNSRCQTLYNGEICLFYIMDNIQQKMLEKSFHCLTLPLSISYFDIFLHTCCTMHVCMQLLGLTTVDIYQTKCSHLWIAALWCYRLKKQYIPNDDLFVQLFRQSNKIWLSRQSNKRFDSSFHLGGWRVRRRDVSDDWGKVLCPEGALLLPVVPQGRAVFGRVDGEILDDLPLGGHVPVHA